MYYIFMFLLANYVYVTKLKCVFRKRKSYAAFDCMYALIQMLKYTF